MSACNNILHSGDEFVEGPARLFVGNLSSTDCMVTIYNMFAAFGPIQKISVGLKDSKPCGFIIVYFENLENAEDCFAYIRTQLLTKRKLIIYWDHVVAFDPKTRFIDYPKQHFLQVMEEMSIWYSAFANYYT